MSNNALSVYMLDFYNNPKNVEDYKINFIKNHYFPTINHILNCNFEDFKVGMSKYNNIIWFCNIKNSKINIMYDHINNLYYIKEEYNKKPYSINIENYINKKDDEQKKGKELVVMKMTNYLM